MLEPDKDTIVVLDCGGQYAHLIANRIRRLGVFSEVHIDRTEASKLAGAKGIIISGGPQSVYAPDAPRVDEKIFELGIPVLGICYGHQLTSHTLHGIVEPGTKSEYGKAHMKKTGDLSGTIFEGLSDDEQVWMSHGDEVKEVPEGFEIIYSTDDCPVTAMANREKKFFGVQFHPEVTHSPCGNTIFENFLKVCGVEKNWSLKQYMEEEIDRIKEQVGDKNVFLLTSGGVDSTVAFVMLSKALGKDRVYGLLVDTGFMRKNEIEEVTASMKELGFDNLHVAEASGDFFTELKEVYEPERKRNIIGAKFLEVKDHWSEKLGLDSETWLLGQGTIYPDTIESGGTQHAATIKTHHNRIDAIEQLIAEGKIVEPLKELYKDEVRELGMEMGVPKHLVMRHPFPGPGLAIRILCGDKEDALEASTAFEKGIKSEYDYQSRVLPIKSVGVQGDARTYAHPLAIFLEGEDINWDGLEADATHIANAHREVNRVVLCLSHDSCPEQLEFMPGYLTPERTKILQEIDALVRNFIVEHDLNESIWQFPVVLLPISGDRTKEAVLLRPVDSTEAMTANFSKIDLRLVRDLTKRIMDTGLVSMVFYDVTNKPPGTIEWE